MTQYIDKDALVGKIKHHIKEESHSYFCKCLLSEIDTLEVKGVDLNEEIEKCLKKHSMLAVGKKDFADIAKHFFELGLKQSSSDEYKLCESEIYLEDDGGEPPYDGKQWLDISCMEYEIPSDKFKVGDKIEIVIRKIKRGE